MRIRHPLLLAIPAAVAIGLGIVAFAGDDPEQVSTADEATSTTSTSTSTTATSTTASTASTTTTTTLPPTTAPPPTAVPPTSPPATSPPATSPPPPPPPPSNPRIATVTAAELGVTWRAGCPVGPEDLRRISVTFRGFDGRDHTGALIVHEDWAEALLGVFDRIHRAGFQIQRIRTIDAYGGSDDASMAANNTSAFNCRRTTNGTSWSRHSYGRAIDINPIQNPYILGSQVLPSASVPGNYHTDRSARQGVITSGDAVVSAFAAIGWQWGGNWTSPIDYQHFDIR